MYSIYVHTTPDGRKYVGSTSQEPYKRFGGGNHYRNNIRFYDAIKFFGWDNIEHQVIDTATSKENALKLEEYYTLLWRTNEPEYGYNIFVGHTQNEETKKKQSEKKIGIKHSEETKKKQSEKVNEFYKNKELSGYALKIISETNRKPVRLKNIKTGEIIEFYSQKKCAEFFGVSNYSVCIFIKGTHKSKIFDDYKVLK